jgi:hypothetical protein
MIARRRRSAGDRLGIDMDAKELAEAIENESCEECRRLLIQDLCDAVAKDGFGALAELQFESPEDALTLRKRLRKLLGRRGASLEELARMAVNDLRNRYCLQH